jgi:cyclophilin family peptidyl-prolyl cis-trans isomerase
MFRSLVAALALVFSLNQEASAVEKKYLTLELEDGPVKIELLPEVAPAHVERVVMLAEQGAYDGVAFHRVIDGFMAQTGDVEHGEVQADGSVSPRAGTGGSDLGNVKAEFSDVPFERGTVGMARSQSPDSANSQFFIVFEAAPHLDGSYTVFGRVVEGMEHVDAIKRGSGQGGTVSQPDKIVRATVSDG